MQWHWERDWIVVAAIFGIVCFMFVVGIICNASGIWVLEEDAHITELGVCLDQHTYAPLHTLPANLRQFYWCGRVQGTTYRSGTLYLFYENEVIFQGSFRAAPGYFFLPATTAHFDRFQPGHYRVEIGYAHLTLAQAEFAVAGVQAP